MPWAGDGDGPAAGAVFAPEAAALFGTFAWLEAGVVMGRVVTVDGSDALLTVTAPEVLEIELLEPADLETVEPAGASFSS